MTPADVLNKAADLIDATGWTQFARARRKNGDKCKPTSPDASCYSVAGAVERILSNASVTHSTMVSIARVFENFIGSKAEDWNDHPDRIQSEVVRALRDSADSADQVQQRRIFRSD